MMFPSGALVIIRSGACLFVSASDADPSWYSEPEETAVVISPWEGGQLDWAWVLSKRGKVLVAWDCLKEHRNDPAW